MKTTRILCLDQAGTVWLGLLEGGFRLKAYQDGAGVWTISAGVTHYERGLRVKKGDVLENAEIAHMLFQKTLLEYEAAVDDFTRDDITQTEFNAHLSACFNIGVPAYKTSTFVKRFNQRLPLLEVAQALGWFDKIRNPTTGELEKSAGLAKRRACEAYLLMYGQYRVQGDVLTPPGSGAGV